MVYLLYDLILYLSALFLVPYAFLKGLPYGNSWSSLKERAGLLSKEAISDLSDGRLFWIHAVSVGEIKASQPLMRELKKHDPSVRIVLSCITFTGNQVARDIEEVDMTVFFPFDLSFVAKKVLRKVSPVVIIIIETEIWPNFIRCAHELNIPLVLANGRISRKSFTRYFLFKPIVSRLLECFSVICVQDLISARRMRRIGAPAEKIQVTGNMKFDLVAEAPSEHSFAARLKNSSELSDRFVWVAGSTRTGENELLVECHRKLLKAGLPSFLILAPRHPESSGTIGNILENGQIPFVLLSELEEKPKIPKHCQVLVVDKIGDLNDFYAIAEVVFVGGILAPKGGHNILEPSCLGKPVLFGPHMFNFQEISRKVLSSGAGCEVANAEELSQMLEQLYFDSHLREKMGQAGCQLIGRNAGATALTLSKVVDIVGP